MNDFIHRNEVYWFEHRAYLEAAGYRLRSKFQPNFTPTEPKNTRNLGDDYSARHPKRQIMDAERILDGQGVILKWVSTPVHPHEVDIGNLFSSPGLSDSPRNHCIRILEVLKDPEDDEKQIIVMPRLIKFYLPIFDTVGEVIDCFRQIFEGVQFMHQHYVAHRDCSVLNIVMDPSKMYPYGFHPIKSWRNPANDDLAFTLTRTQCWPRYYLIDFGLSRQYNPQNGPPLEEVIRGGDKSPPEHQQESCNPFPTDIYYLGNLLKEEFIHSDATRSGGVGNHKPLRFLKPLADAMTQPNPAMRPTISEVISQFDHLCRRLTNWKLRQPGQALDPFSWVDQRLRQFKNTMNRVSPLPRDYEPPPPLVLTTALRAFYTKTPAEWESELEAERQVVVANR
ncbi:hypothetical protein C8R46DRAFT_1192814 [Mycena filopes]|nr:hypothetical protein C8R46DRAFT_1192814 [Mycena filopes]